MIIIHKAYGFNFITPENQSLLNRKSLFFPSKLTEFYLANQHVMKEIIIAKIDSKLYDTTFNRYNQQHYNSKNATVFNF